MGETITLEVKLRAFVRKEKKGRWSAVCPSVGVASQGVDREDAERSLKEAVEAWFESCVERGVLDQALRESNFRPLRSNEPIPRESGSVVVSRDIIEDDSDVLGDLFSVQFEIPAYQAAAFLQVSA